VNLNALAIVLLSILVTDAPPAVAQERRPQGVPPGTAQPSGQPQAPAPAAERWPAAPAAPTGQLPSQTTATFGDWVHRCVRVGNDASARSCEIVQQVQASQGGQVAAVMNLAIGYAAPQQPLMITAVLPVNVSFSAPATLVADGMPPTELRFVRCAGNACFATASAPDQLLRRLREKADGGAVRVEYRNASDAVVPVPLSLKGFGLAIDALVAAPPR
jgi:invasion protein IalB